MSNGINELHATLTGTNISDSNKMQQVIQILNNLSRDYHGRADIISEMIANAIDSLMKKLSDGPVNNSWKPTIHIVIDAITRTIQVRDNGAGGEFLNLEKLDEFTPLSLFQPTKNYWSNQYGGKGVANLFLVSQCNNFSIKLGKDNKTYQFEIQDGYNLRTGKIKAADYVVKPLSVSRDGVFEGAELTLEDVQESPLFSLTTDQLMHVLRTETPIGNLEMILQPNEISDIQIFLKYVKDEEDYLKEPVKIQYGYCSPAELLDKGKSLINLQELLCNENITDQDYYSRVHNAYIELYGDPLALGGKIYESYSFCVPSIDAWENINRKIDFNEKTQGSTKSHSNSDKDLFGYKGGIFVFERGRPLPIRVPIPNVGTSGYVKNIIFCVNVSYLSLDTGRKSLKIEEEEIIQDLFRKNYNSIRNNYWVKVKNIEKKLKNKNNTVTEPKVSNLNNGISQKRGLNKSIDNSGALSNKLKKNAWDRQKHFEQAKAHFRSYDSKFLKFGYSNRLPEKRLEMCMVELIAKGCFYELIPLPTGANDKYDLLASWRNKDIVIEFKTHLRYIFSDLSAGEKSLEDIDYLICYGIHRDDWKEGYELKEFNGERTDVMPETTHVLYNVKTNEEAFVINLKNIFDSYTNILDSLENLMVAFESLKMHKNRAREEFQRYQLKGISNQKLLETIIQEYYEEKMKWNTVNLSNSLYLTKCHELESYSLLVELVTEMDSDIKLFETLLNKDM
ncbi:hypothetical protein I0292_26545 (plasmid) [Priestia megaterium]|uniref:hypothetical protein n=1 Tax=Priestia megaterium TaxID=1404 RepID=UPI0020707355|nr:hypothetical protein [Priestia megaterium]UOO43809.1 hypothetical protein I0292_26545 [Priestia megaterium]